MTADVAAIALFLRPDLMELANGQQVDGQELLSLYSEYLDESGAAWFVVPGLTNPLREARVARVEESLARGMRIPVLFAAGPEHAPRITHEAALIGLKAYPEPANMAAQDIPPLLQGASGRVWIHIAGLRPVDRGLEDWVVDGLGLYLEDAVQAHYQFGFVQYQPPVRRRACDELAVVEHLERFLAARGFQYAPEILRSFWIGLKAGDFLLLGGISGSGKSSLPALVAEAIGAEFQRVRVTAAETVPLFGAEQADRGGPLRVICLDGVNRGRIAEFLPDLLETMDDGTDRMAGTLTNDASASQLPRSVWERVTLLELTVSPEDLAAHSPSAVPVEPLQLSAEDFRSLVATTGDTRYRAVLAEIARILARAGIHIGYRLRNEIERFMANGEGLLSPDELFDLQVLQRLLPLMYGTGSRLRESMTALSEFCAEKGLRRSQARLAQMLERLDRDGLVDHRW